jgi:alkylation response protein AidB-like acyl-CoA dehydrogenase
MQERKAFGKSIGDFQAIQFMLADAATELMQHGFWSCGLPP